MSSGRERLARATPAVDPLLAAAAGVVTIAAIGVVDDVTGPLWSMSVFYLVPVAVATGVAGRRVGAALAALSALSGLLSDVVLQPHYAHRTVAAWNVMFMFCTLLVVVELVDRLRRRALEARQAELRGREFLAFAAHQLRTPIAAIRSTADALVVSGREGPEHEELLRAITSESARAGRLVNSLLRIARLDQHEPLPLRQADLAGLVEAEVQRARARAGMIEWSLVSDGAIDVFCNPESLGEAVAALLDNAQRHARERVSVLVRAVDGAAEVTVSDDGPGLPAGKAAAAFDRFVTLDGGGGSGLGLPIARGIAEAHGGSLHYADGRFTIRVPSHTRPAAAAARRASALS